MAFQNHNIHATASTAFSALLSEQISWKTILHSLVLNNVEFKRITNVRIIIIREMLNLSICGVLWLFLYFCNKKVATFSGQFGSDRLDTL